MEPTGARHNKRLRSERVTAARQLGRHTVEQWEALREFCGFRCVRCGRNGHQDRDHILPIYLGGSDGIDNIQPLCAWCNSSKGPDATDHRPSGWREAISELL
jgi:5-methylcytosine-specific restriction endonuclease McrA